MNNNIKVFIIEDEIKLVKIYKRYLEEKKYNVIGYALNGMQAVDSIENNIPDIILSDINLPGEIDGISAVEIIQRKYEIPVIFITAHVDDKLIERVKKIKFATYLHKPVDIHSMFSSIEIALYQKNADNIFINSISEAYSYNRIIYDENENAIDFITVGINKQFEKITGLSKHYFCGKEVSKIYDFTKAELKNQFNFLLEKYSKLKPESEKIEFEMYSHLSKRWFNIIAYSPKQGHFITLSTDITELKNKTQNLVEYYTTLQLVPSIVIITDIDGNIQYANPAFEKNTGYVISNVAGKNAGILKVGKYDEAFYKKLWDTIKSGEIWQGEFCNKKKNGEIYYESAVIGSIKDEKGNIINFIKTAEDITEKKEIELELKRALKEVQNVNESLKDAFEKLKNLEYIINRSPVMVFLWKFTDDFPVEYVSKNIYQLGYTPEDFYSHKSKWIKVTHPDDVERLKGEIENYIKNGIDEFSQNYRIIMKDGGIRYIEDKKNVIKDDNGNITYFQGILLDVTERVKAESDAKTKQMQIIQSGKLAALGQLAAGIAHEINQPLSGISMGIDNIIKKLRMKTANEEYLNDKCNRIMEYIERIKSIIEHIRIYSREQSSHEFHRFNIISSIQCALSILKTQYSNKNIKISTEWQKNEYSIIGNEFKLEQVILNLMSNAKDAVFEKKEKSNKSGVSQIYQPEIIIRVFEEKKTVCLEIEDNGCGIPEENIEKIFEPFYTTKIAEKGTGLGLSITFSLIEEMNGEISAASKIGEWTKFSMKFNMTK